MNKQKLLKNESANISKHELEKYLQKSAINHKLSFKSNKNTYPIEGMKEDFKYILSVYNLLNDHMRLGITIHPAGEWLLDNLYIIEEVVKQIENELPLNKYLKFVGIENGSNRGFARIYVIANEIIGYTDGNVSKEDIEGYLKSYQINKSLSMEEIWNIGIFLQISLIQKIRKNCEKIYISQMEKYRAENIVERLVECENKIKFQNSKKYKFEKNNKIEMKYSFIEYLSYILKRYGKKGNSYIKILEEIIEMSGSNISDIIKKEHFDIAIRKVSMGNSINSMRRISRINFTSIFEKINDVEAILKKDRANVYSNMNIQTKELYRNTIKEISSQTKISEIYIAKKVLELCEKYKGEKEKNTHIGYYLIDKGVEELYKSLNYTKNLKRIKNKREILNINSYVIIINLLTIILDVIYSYIIYAISTNIIFGIITFIIFILPIFEVSSQIVGYILRKSIESRIIPKMDYSKGIPENKKTMVVIPTIIKKEEKVKELMKKIEIFYLANKSENIYFTILGDCAEGNRENEEYEEKIIEKSIELLDDLNNKYKEQGNENIKKFNFIYRKRTWSSSEKAYIGWERKRGMLTQFNQYLLSLITNPFKENSFERYSTKKDELKKIKYVITLDSDTDLILNSGFELIGAMGHILNQPVIDEIKGIVVEGYGIIQPRVGIDLEAGWKSNFSKIFAGDAGINLYTNASSNIYQDNFDEGIFTGKGIYNLEIFEKVLKNQIPENTVLSHDLLEGSYLRCGLASDISIMDGYPSKYSSYSIRQSRWIRGDWQILKWISSKSPLNKLSKFKILDNLRRSVFEITILIGYIYLILLEEVLSINLVGYFVVLTLIAVVPYIIELIDKIIFKKDDELKTKTYEMKIDGVKGILIKSLISIGTIPHKSYVAFISIVKTIYRMKISKQKLLQWTTAEEAEQQSIDTLKGYFSLMYINIILGLIFVVIGSILLQIIPILLGLMWLITIPIMWYISQTLKFEKAIDKLNENDKKYLLEISKKTWEFFEKYLVEKYNYLITDNYQENRKSEIVLRTSSTNIGLSLLAVISAYDMEFIEKERARELLKNIIDTIESLPKLNGHLYNWYNIETKEPLVPRYISTVDSGNFVGYLYVTKIFFKEEFKEDIEYIELINKIIENTDFKILYKEELQIFSIGFNVEENKLTDSYYDLLASEARQASYVAIAKKDIPSKHWNSLSKTLTTVGKYKGLVSWSGTAFEYLMPNVNIPVFKGSLLDESMKFLIDTQMEYAKKMNLPWGISESAFNLKDLDFNYQYKAFGVPWLGLKRGLADEQVISPYASILGIGIVPKDEIYNLNELEKLGMYGKFGFYEAIDFTPERVEKGKKGTVVKTYMAHHQALSLLSLNNLFNNNILQKRFMENPEIEAVKILLQEVMPEKSIITKEEKEKVEKLKYKDYQGYVCTTHDKIDENYITGNVISNEDYVIAINQKGEGFSKYKDIYINRFKETNDYAQGIFFIIKNIKTKKIWSSSYSKNKKTNYKISFMPDKVMQEVTSENIKSKIETTIASNSPSEIRRLALENLGNDDEILEVTAYFEPIISKKEQDYAHPAFNNLFLVSEFDEETESLIIKRKNREENKKEMHIGINLSTNCDNIGDLEYEIDSEKFIGRGNLNIPNMVENSIPFNKKIGLVTEPIVALRRTVKIKAKEKKIVNLIISINDHEAILKEEIEKLKNIENIEKEFELARARVDVESRYLRIKGEEIKLYQKMLSLIIFNNCIKNSKEFERKDKVYKQEKLWKYGISGDLKIILVKIHNANDRYIISEVLKAYEFFRTKNIDLEIVIINEEKYSYENYLKGEIENEILNNNMGYLKNIRGGIFTILREEIDKDDIEILEFIASITIDSKIGGISNNIKELEEQYKDNIKKIGNHHVNEFNKYEEKNDIDILENKEKLKYYNEYGGFSEDGKEYLIRINKNNRLPTVWSNIMGNEKFGTLVTENMGGYSWYKNSRLNRVTSWSNNPVLDIPNEVIYIKNLDNGKTWSLGLNPMPDDNNYNVIYGFGYTKYIHKSQGIEQELEVFVAKEDSVKLQILNLKNTDNQKKKIKIYYYIKPVLGEDEIQTNRYINLEFKSSTNMILAKNKYKNELENTVMYTSNTEKILSYTGNKDFFFGKTGLTNPEGIQKLILSNENALFKNSIIVYEIEIELEAYQNKEIGFILGCGEEQIECENIAYKYSKIQNIKNELSEVKIFWKEKLKNTQVYTPIESTNILLNGWIPYQVMTSRLLGRTGYYQSGGAFGYRDQLQDTFGLKYIDKNLLKNQIIKHSKHQFIEGDVEHWWHDESGRGIRTKFSDDLLWLAYAVIEYIKFTNDYTILDIKTPYKIGKILEEGIDERYDKYENSEISETIYEHVLKAINKSLDFGENGIPKIGSGDWNDGFSTVGNKGKGESVWLGFFLYKILVEMMDICKYKNDIDLVEKYNNIAINLKKSLNTKAWDGRWYRRAYMDDGKILGTMQNDECKIDSLSQSWSVISGAGENDKKYISMESLQNHLIDKENGIIKLLDPPFEKSNLNPGYIKAYLPGVRENGGQYTHAAVWVIIAKAMLGFGDEAFDLYKTINPIEHSRTKDECKKYKVEPYVMPADIYGVGNLAGRGGWTWYTGAASWYYKAGIETILGVKHEKGYLLIDPTIPKDWKEYQVKYKWENNIYNITVRNPNGKSKIEKEKIEKNRIKLEHSDENKTYNVEIIM